VPPLTRWLVKAALCWLVAALVLGLAMQLPLAAHLPLLRAAWPTYLHLLVVGWLTQLIFGVAFWLFPRYSADRPRGSDRLGWASFVCLNLGLILRVFGEPRRALGADAGTLLLLSAVAQLLAVLAFVLNTWPRVRER
jgi:heme/copper-type cytochrome/quinol oxidase subunit 1